MVPDTSKLPFANELALPMATLLSDTARSCCTSPSASRGRLRGQQNTSSPPEAKEAPASVPAPAEMDSIVTDVKSTERSILDRDYSRYHVLEEDLQKP